MFQASLDGVGAGAGTTAGAASNVIKGFPSIETILGVGGVIGEGKSCVGTTAGGDCGMLLKKGIGMSPSKSTKSFATARPTFNHVVNGESWPLTCSYFTENTRRMEMKPKTDDRTMITELKLMIIQCNSHRFYIIRNNRVFSLSITFSCGF